MIRALIIEDEQPAINRLQKLLSDAAPDIQVTDHCDSIESSVKWLRQNPHPELIFLDIQLADGLSFEIFKMIKTDSFVIVTTAYDEYAIKAFELKSIDYLLKPINKDHLARAIEKYRQMKGTLQFDVNELLKWMDQKKSDYKSRFVINVGNKIRTVEASDIAYFCSLEKNTFLSSKEGKTYPVDFSLDHLETLLNPEEFFRVNRQFLVNFKAILAIKILSKSRIRLELSPGSETEVFVSNARASEFRKWLDK